MRLTLAILTLLSTLLPWPAVAQQRTCMPLDQMDARLASEFREALSAGGISDDGTLVRLYQSGDGTFTVVKVTPQKFACVVDFGKGWQVRSDPAPETEEGL